MLNKRERESADYPMYFNLWAWIEKNGRSNLGQH